MTKLPSLDQLISLKGKRALITGAAAGIGKAIAYRFGEAGADLELADIDPAALPRTTCHHTDRWWFPIGLIPYRLARPT